jgi:hypothetical protein
LIEHQNAVRVAIFFQSFVADLVKKTRQSQRFKQKRSRNNFKDYDKGKFEVIFVKDADEKPAQINIQQS